MSSKYFDDNTIEKIRRGYYSAVYFNRTKQILLKEKNHAIVTMQIFQKHEESILCGIDEVIELLKLGSGYWEGNTWVSMWNEMTINTLQDGDMLSSRETVMHITGPYVYFAHLESLYLGMLAQRTVVATNMRKAVHAAKDTDVIFFADRFDDFHNQEGNGYAAHIGGAAAVCTQAHTAWFDGKSVGTIPHALIAMYNGDTIAAAEAFAKEFPEVPLIVLADFTNDCVATAVSLARILGKRLWGVRLDTSETMIDASLQHRGSGKELYGVNAMLVTNVRTALDRYCFDYVKIVVSGGFTPEKIQRFEEEHVPVDAYGVGSSMVHGENDFTADIVTVNGKHIAKFGREYKENKKLHLYNG